MSIKETIFFGAAVGTFLVLIAKVCSVGMPSLGSGRIQVRLFPQHSSIVHLDQADFLGKARVFFVDRIEFPIGDQLSHPNLGNLGYKTDLGMELSGSFELPRAGNWLFEVASDDGFSLKIDDALVGEHRSDGAQEKIVLRAPLEGGRHKLVLNYFQGFGPLGLVVRFKNEESATWHVLGDGAGECRFVKP